MPAGIVVAIGDQVMHPLLAHIGEVSIGGPGGCLGVAIPNNPTCLILALVSLALGSLVRSAADRFHVELFEGSGYALTIRYPVFFKQNSTVRR